jgi:signal transduction histidine kinase
VWILGTLVLVIATVALRNAVSWYERPFPGVLVDPAGLVSNISMPGWETERLSLRFPERIRATGGERSSPGSRAWVEAWDAAVVSASGSKVLSAEADSGSTRRRVELAIRPLEPLAWWAYAGGALLGGLLYAGAGLVSLRASPRGLLARAFAKFAITGGVFLLCLFDAHTSRTLAPLFFLCFGWFPFLVVGLVLNLPEPIALLRARPSVQHLLDGLGFSFGLALVATYFADRDTRPLQSLATLLLGVSFVVFVSGFLFRYSRLRGEQRNNLRALLVCSVPPYAALGILALMGLRGHALVFPALVFAPLASLYAFVRYDLWGSRALLSRIGTNFAVAALACAVAIAAGAALAAGTGAAFGDALAGAAGGGVAAAVLVVVALRVSDSTLFRSRAQYKPTIELLSEELTSLTSPAQVAQAIERTVRRQLPCEYVVLVHAAPPSRNDEGSIRPPRLLSNDRPVNTSEESTPEPPRGSETELRLPVSFGGHPLAYLDLGAKAGGALFTSEDIDLLRTIVNHGGLALAHAHAYQELEARRKQQAEAWRGEREALVETVAAEIAHEIRYPINFFRSVFERFARGDKPDEEDVDVGREEVDRLERLVSGLKRMATHRLDRVPTNLSELCGRVATLLGDALGDRPLELEVAADVTLRCDPDKTTQVLVNLLSNGLDASGPHGRVGVEWKATPQGAELSVWDDGPGFVGDPSRLFAPWYTTKARGTGLGLAITHRLVRAHGWSVSAQRRDGRTHFVISIRNEDIVRESEPRSRSDAQRVA